MTNQTELDELDRLTNPDLVKKAMQEASRPQTRPKWTSALVDFASDPVVPYEGEVFNRKARLISLRVINMRNIKTVEGTVFDNDEDAIVMEIPQKPSDNSEPALMVESAIRHDKSINTIRALPGKKNVLLVERVHEYPYRRPKTNDLGETVKDDAGKDIWESVTGRRYYYSVESVGKDNVSAASEAKPTEEAIKVALSLLGEDGMEEEDFKGAALRNGSIQKDSALMKLIPKGEFITQMIAEGKVIRDGEKLKVV